MSQFSIRKSYSIEAEDILLETIFCCVLKFFGPGTYIDIGAAHPIEYSNTYFFYEKGWRGICVEPNPDYFAHYKSLRPEDKALNVGLAEKSGDLEYHRFVQPLVNGFYGKDQVDRQIATGEVYLGSTIVPCLGVSDFLKSEAVNKQIDLLNIDVEWLDATLLAAWNWDLCRPKIVCAEIHTLSINTMLKSEVARVMKRAGYTPMCRGWLSTIFVADELLNDGESARPGFWKSLFQR